jgi:ElaB/YqjD/DUF883 family membrane-anchored ribosome-binding protein
MNEPEPYTPFEPGGESALSDERSRIPTETTYPTSKFESQTKHTRRATDDLDAAARATADEYRGKAEHPWDGAQELVRSFRKDGEQYVRENPTKAIFSVLGIGFVLGLIFRR